MPRSRRMPRSLPGAKFGAVTATARGQGLAFARAALAGNPSDAYGGAVLAVTVPVWRAEAVATRSPEPSVSPESRLVEATVARLARELSPATLRTAVQWTTSIPQRVGLGSSSALVIAVARAVCELHTLDPSPEELAELALAVEVQDLGIEAGLQDRVAQAYGGLTFMDFSGAGNRYERLDPSLLPAFLIAWLPGAAQDSGHVHDSLRDRYGRGEPGMRVAMVALAAAAKGARDALASRDRAAFHRSVNWTFDLRRELLMLDHRCVEMVEVARAAGASANYTGSGGAIVALCDERERGLAEVEEALRARGCETVQYAYGPCA